MRKQLRQIFLPALTLAAAMFSATAPGAAQDLKQTRTANGGGGASVFAGAHSVARGSGSVHASSRAVAIITGGSTKSTNNVALRRFSFGSTKRSHATRLRFKPRPFASRRRRLLILKIKKKLVRNRPISKGGWTHWY